MRGSVFRRVADLVARRWDSWIVPALALLMMGLFRGTYLQHQVNLAGIYAVGGMGLTVMFGMGGLLSLGHGGFFLMGGYVSSLLSLRGWPVGLSVPFAAGAVAAVAALVGTPLVRLHGYFLALGSLALGVVTFTLANSLSELTGGPSGLAGIPSGWLGSPDSSSLLIWGLCTVAYLCVRGFWRSPAGLAVFAVHSDEMAAVATGIHVAGAKLGTFVFGSALAGLAGGLYAHYNAFLSPVSGGLAASIEFLVMCLLGGFGSPLGAVLGALLYQAVREVSVIAHELRYYVHGLLLIVILVYMPGGLELLLRQAAGRVAVVSVRRAR